VLAVRGDIDVTRALAMERAFGYEIDHAVIRYGDDAELVSKRVSLDGVLALHGVQRRRTQEGDVLSPNYEWMVSASLDDVRPLARVILSEARRRGASGLRDEFGAFVSFIQQLRQRSNVPVVVISARRDEYEKIHALQMGADDYLFKPTNLLELDARITAILRRVSLTRHAISTPYLQLDASNRSVVINGQVIEVTAMEFAIILTMMTTPDRVFSRQELTALMFGEQFGVGRAIDVHISNIRNKIELNPNKPIYIVTVYGKGYRYQEHTQHI
jgi:DNA-binding response OmpR family regulator